MNRQIALVHLHLDFEKHLAELLRKWNAVQNAIEFVGVRPSRMHEHPLLTPGVISDDDASRIAAQIRTAAGYSADDDIIVFTEKRVFDDTYNQLFVGGREADEDPPRVAILSLDYLRRSYNEAKGDAPVFLGAIVSNILFSIGTDAGLDDHGDKTRGCIMDFCGVMSDIEIGLTQGPKFCRDCTNILESQAVVGDAILALPEAFKSINDIKVAEREVTEAVLLRGKRYADDADGYDYDIALSFSGNDREYAELLADHLKRDELAVFYDRAEQADLWGRNLQTHLAELYRIRARFCIVLVSKHYVTSRWTQVELEAALAREFELREPYILPLQLDDTRLEQLLSTKGYIDTRQFPIEDIVELVKQKIAALLSHKAS